MIPIQIILAISNLRNSLGAFQFGGEEGVPQIKEIHDDLSKGENRVFLFSTGHFSNLCLASNHPFG